MPQLLCKCGMWVSNAGPSMQKHLLSMEHGSRLDTQKKSVAGFTIFVSGFNNSKIITTDILRSLFDQFGKIESCFLAANKKFAFVQFDTIEAATKAVDTAVKWENLRLLVRPKQNKRQAYPDVCSISNDIKIEPIGSWEQQVRQLMIALGMSFTPLPPEYDDRINSVCESITNTLSPTFTPCQTFVFGSRRTGLAKLNSDVDVYVDLNISEYIQAADPDERESAEFKLRVFKLCVKNFHQGYLFSHILSVEKARCPILKCVHKNTGIHCDISFKNALSVWNSCLIKYYLKLDDRIKFMVVTLRQWIRTLYSDYLSPYSLCMMLFFYLCRLPNPLLPSVKELMLQDHNLVYAAGWQCSFAELDYKTKNVQCIRLILADFFEFLATFDFGIYVMCVQDATIVPKWQFLSAQTLPDTQETLRNAMYKEQLEFPAHSCVCLQDPLELAHNTTRAINTRYLEDFRNKCMSASHYCANNPLSLNGLFHSDKSYTRPQNHIHIEFCNFFPPIERLQTDEDIRHIWYDEVLSVIKDIFQFIFHFETRGDTSPPLFKLSKPNDKCVTLKLDSKYRLWDQRKKIAGDMKFPSNIHIFEKQIKISQGILNRFYKDNDSKKYDIKIDIDIYYKTSPTKFVLQVIDHNSKTLDQVEKSSKKLPVEKNNTTGLLQYLNSNLQQLVDKCVLTDYKAFIEDTEKSEEKMEINVEAPQPSSSTCVLETQFERIAEGISKFQVKTESIQMEEMEETSKKKMQDSTRLHQLLSDGFPPSGFVLHETYTYIPTARRDTNISQQNDEVVVVTPVKEEKVIPVVDLEDTKCVDTVVKRSKYGPKLVRKRLNTSESTDETFSPQTVVLSTLSKKQKKKKEKK